MNTPTFFLPPSHQCTLLCCCALLLHNICFWLGRTVSKAGQWTGKTHTHTQSRYNSISIWWHLYLPPSEKTATGGYLYWNAGGKHTHTHQLFTTSRQLAAYLWPNVKTFLCKNPWVFCFCRQQNKKQNKKNISWESQILAVLKLIVLECSPQEMQLDFQQ